MNILKQTLQENVTKESDVFKYQKQFLKLLPIIVNLSESEAKYREENYNHLVEVLISVIINTIPGANINQLLVISRNLEALLERVPDKRSLNVPMAQLMEIMNDYLESIKKEQVLVKYARDFSEILVNIAPVYMKDNAEREKDSVEIRLKEQFKRVVLRYFDDVSKITEGIVWKDVANVYLLNQLIKRIEIDDKEINLTNLRKRIVEVHFDEIAGTESLALNYLLCFSLYTPSVSRLSRLEKDNVARFVDYLGENLDIKLLNEDTLQLFFEIYANLAASGVLSLLQISSQDKLEKIKRSLMRFIADHHKKLSIKGLEDILEECIRAGLLESNFDDGSGLYEQNLVQELNEHLTKNLKEFSVSFQDKVKPYLEKYAEATAFETLTETLKNISL